MSRINRRECLKELLKLAGSVTTAAAVLPFTNLWHAFGASIEVDPEAPPASLGRIATWSVEIREAPEREGKLVRAAKRDEVLPLREQVVGEAVMPHNSIWYKTDEGYAYSSWIQPVEEVKNPAEPDKAAEKFWGEITVPFIDSRYAPDPNGGRSMRLYYTGVFRVIGAVMGKDEQWWYRLQDGVTYSPGPYVPATDVRRFDPTELTPLSPEIMTKRVEVNLKEQTITAYEYDKPVLTSRVASGYGGFRTPSGTHKVLFKNPTARMIGGQGSDFYDLPGVPFPTFITWSGVAIHGAYWHNDFGRPRSHGCLNVPADVARWFWRWTSPIAPYEAAVYYTPRGSAATTVTVM